MKDDIKSHAYSGVQLKMALRKRYEQCLLHLQICGEGSVIGAHHKVP